MHHRMKQIEEQLAEVKQSCSRNEEGLTQVQSEVGKIIFLRLKIKCLQVSYTKKI
jgi:hypothetical protein